MTLRIPVRLLAGPIWLATRALAAYGWSWKRAWDPGTRRLVAISVGLPVVAMLPYFAFGLANYPGSHLPDGWSYVAYGQYLWNYPRGTPPRPPRNGRPVTHHRPPHPFGLLSHRIP